MNTSAFDILVIGNEIAGLWFLRRYLEVTRMLPETSSRRVAWLRLPDARESTLVPTVIAEAFGLPSATHELEMITPHRVFRWNRAFLETKGMDIGKLGIAPSPAQWKEIRHNLRLNPELLGFASGIWKWTGLSPTASAERLVWAAALCHRYGQVTGPQMLPPEVTVIELASTASVSKMEWQKNKKWLLELNNGEQAIEVGDVILNGHLGELEKILPSELLTRQLPRQSRADIHQGPFPIRTTLPTDDVPGYLQPLSFLFDTEEIPDPDHEVWPLTVEAKGDQTEVSLWAQTEAQIPLAEARLRALLPTIPANGLSFQASPNLRRPRAASVLLSHETRHPQLNYFGPELRAQYPFPLGPLLAAKECARRILGGKILRRAQQVLDKRV